MLERKCHELSPFNAYDHFVMYGAPSLRWSNPYAPKEYSQYIQKLAKVQFKERKQQITWKGTRIVSAFVTDVLERLGGGGRACDVVLGCEDAVCAVCRGGCEAAAP